MKKRPFLLFLLALLAPVLACGLPGSSDADATATLAALNTSIAQSAQANATPTIEVPESAVEDADAPTATAGADGATAAQATATARSVQATATTSAVSTQEVLDAAATATRRAPILEELATYGVDPNQGRLAWIHQPITIETEGYLQYNYANQNISTVAQDFVLAGDITWNTRFGTTGCGFVLRSDGDEEENFDQYLVIATRGASGHVGFVIMQDGEVKTNEITDIYANGIDPLFEWQNDTTNRLTVVARGNTFTIYTNGTRIGEVTPSVAYERGFVAFVALNESGDTTCHYEDTWLWLIE